MGMDWHSSGITTRVIGALKRGLAPLSGELGMHVCGGRGAHSRKTPARACSDRRARRLRRRGAGARQPAGRQGRQRRRAGRVRSLSARLHRRRRRDLGRRPAGHERASDGRRGATTGCRRAWRASSRRRMPPSRARPGRDRQPHRPPRRSVARRAARAARRTRARTTSPGAGANSRGAAAAPR